MDIDVTNIINILKSRIADLELENAVLKAANAQLGKLAAEADQPEVEDEPAA